ncbi:MAG: hypothetical protein R3217_08560 [Gammaproteobacteria bacterium]|nr:hypothetical protein [Gammaproteobacteria bacterium]
MFSKFKDGLAFGAGFGISFIIIFYFASFGMSAVWSLMASGNDTAIEQESGKQPCDSKKLDEDEAQSQLSSMDVWEWPLDARLEDAELILILTYEAGEDGRNIAIITDILKQQEPARYKEGDEFSSESFYPGGNRRSLVGKQVFVLEGDRYSTTSGIYDGHVPALENISIDKMRKTLEAQKGK